MNRKLPAFLKKYFWDVEFKEIDPAKHRIDILRRILEYGDKEAIVWMWKNFKNSDIETTLSKYRGFSQKSANFWAVILKIHKEKVKCLNKSFLATQKQFWPY